MNPAVLFPALALLFALLASVNLVRTRRWSGATSTWALMAVIFAAVSLWLHA